MAKQLVSTGQYTLVDVGDYTSTGLVPPKNPVANQSIWIDTSQKPPLQKIWNGTAWVIVNETKVGGRNLVLNSKNPREIYKSETTGETYIYYNISEGKLEPNTEYILSWEYLTSNNYKPGMVYFVSGSSASEHRVIEGIEKTNNTWVKKEWKFKTGTNPNQAGSIRFDHKGTTDGQSCLLSVRMVKLEKGNIATDHTIAPEDLDAAILAAQTAANTANNLLTEIASDAKLSPSDKISLKREYDIIVAEKPTVVEQATPYAVSVTAFNTAYNDLVAYVSPLVANLTTTSDVTGTILRSLFAAYYSEKMKILKEISVKVTSQFATVNGQITATQTALSNFQTEVNGAFKDGIIFESEAIAIEKYKNQINTEKDGLQNQYNVIYADAFLTGTPKSDLLAAWNNYVIAHTNLLNSINTAIADKKTDVTEKQDVDVKFTLYRNSLANLSTRFQEALKVIDKAAIDNIQIGGRNLIIQSRLQPGYLNGGTGGVVWSGTDYHDPNYYACNGGDVFTHTTYEIYTTGYGGGGYMCFYDANKTFISYALLSQNGVKGTKTVTSPTNAKFYRVASIGKGVKEKLEKGNKATDWTQAPEDLEAEIALVKSEINDVDNKLSSLQTNFTSFSNDGVIDIAEAKALKNIAQTLNTEKEDVYQKYLGTYNNVNLIDKAPLQTAWNSYNSNHGTLLSYINTYTAGNRAISPAELATVNNAFTNYRNALSALSAALETALKDIANKKIDNIQIGGRNLIIQSRLLPGWLSESSGLPAGSAPDVHDPNYYDCNAGEVFTHTTYNIYITGYGGGGYMCFYNENKAFISAFLLSQNGKKGSKIVTAPQNAKYYRVSSIGKGIKEKLEKGNKATDYDQAPEDTAAEIALAKAQATNAQNTAAAAAAVTSFLQTDVNTGNVISTGTLQVGSATGANAGITGVVDRGSESVRFYAGSTYAGKNTADWLVRDDGVEEQWFNGVLVRQRGVINGAYIETWYNLNGQIGKKITFSPAGKIQEEWYNNGDLVYQIGQNGIYYVSEIPESFTEQRMEVFNNLGTRPALIKSHFRRKETPLGSLYPFIVVQISPFNNKTTYLYNAGQSASADANRVHEGYKNTQLKTDSIADGNYVFADSSWDVTNNDTLNVRVKNIVSGKVTGTFVESFAVTSLAMYAGETIL